MLRLLVLALFSLLCISSSFLVSWYLYSNETEQISYQFEREIGKRVDSLEQELIKHRATLRHWKSFFEAADATEGRTFKRVAEDVLRIYPSLQMVAWAPLVRQERKQAFEEQTRKEWSQFKIYDINSELVTAVSSGDKVLMEKAMKRVRDGNPLDVAEQRAMYFPFLYVEPMESKGYLLGVDLNSVNKLTYDIQMALSAEVDDVVAMPVFASPFTPEHEAVLMAIVPVFDTMNHGHKSLRGFVAASIVVDDLVMRASMSDVRDINFTLQDETGDKGMRELYRLGDVDMNHANLQKRMVLPVFGRQWVVYASPKPGFAEERRSALPWIVAFGGTVITLAVMFYMLVLIRQQAVVQRLVEKRTRELREANKSLSEANVQLEEMSRTDGLTKVANRRYFNEVLDAEWRKALRSGKPLAVILMDVDFFKRYNDHYGHLAGDECLRAVAAALKATFTRAGDLVARYGGEEFAVILPNTGGDAVHAAERARGAIAAVALAHAKSDVAPHVTVSVGVSSVTPQEGWIPDALVDSADQGLYLAKENGRNRVIYHTFHAPDDSLDLDMELSS